LCINGGVAIFCGTKNTAINVCKRVTEIVENGYSIKNIQDVLDNEELLAISKLCEQNLGTESVEAKSAKFGVLAHHNNIPHGIRLAVEYAMREYKIRIVVCTSTLAQGVNLPIRYLIVRNLYQGRNIIRVRDFHNLIGRAGRAGKYIEGSILFAESKIYDNKNNKRENRLWKETQSLLDINKTESCDSSLLDIFKPIENEQRNKFITFDEGIESFEGIIDAFIKDQIKDLAINISENLANNGFDFETVYGQLFYKCQLLESLENFLLAHWEDLNENTENWVSELANQTLAFYLADDEKKKQIIKTFQLLSNNIAQNIHELKRKKIFGKTLYGIKTAVKIEIWVNNNQQNLMKIIDIEEFIEMTWELFCEIIESNTNKSLFTKFDQLDIRKNIIVAWLSGKSFAELLILLNERNVCKIYGRQKRKFTVEDMVDVCENTFAFEGSLFVGAIIEFLDSLNDFDLLVKEQFQIFQKRFKYGLPNVSSINVYELGFSDRYLSQEIASSLNNQNLNKGEILHMINNPDISHLIEILPMPSYYKHKFQTLQGKNSDTF